MATYDQIRSLCTAFAQRNDARFRRTVSQMAARMSAARGQELLRLVNDAPRIMEIIPSEARGVVYEAPACDVELSLSESLSRELELLRREWRAAAELRDAGLCPRGRLLFWGPPGNGKSTAAAQLGRSLSFNVFVCSLSQIVGSHMGETGKSLERAASLLGAGHCLILEECDAIGATRHAGFSAADQESNRALSTLLTALDRFKEGLLIATTNSKDMIDPALLRRFDECIEFPAPEGFELDEFLRRKIKDFPLTELPKNVTVESYDAATKLLHAAARRAIVERMKEVAE